MLKILKNILKIIYSFLRQQISKIKILLLLRDRSEFFLEIGAGNKNGVDNWLTIDMTKIVIFFGIFVMAFHFQIRALIKSIHPIFLNILLLKKVKKI